MSQPTTPKPHDYLRDHLSHELWSLLCAATEWHVQQRINPDDNLKGQHIKMYAMNSAALHARALFEFFTPSTRPNHIGVDLFGLDEISSDIYGDRDSDPALGCWTRPLHAFLMHLQDRSVTQRLKSFGESVPEMKDLNRMPVDFAREVVRLWGVFVEQLRDRNNPLHADAQTVLDTAIARAALVVTAEITSRHGIEPIAW